MVKPVALSDFLRETLPERHAQYADAYAIAALAWAPTKIGSHDFALLHAGVIEHESGAGRYLSPRGPDGVGDLSPRWFVWEKIPSWVAELELLTGNSRTNENTGKDEFEVKPPAWAGAEIAGWGYGLGQLDFADTKYQLKDWLAANDWKSPPVNLLKSAEILRLSIDHFEGDVHFGVAGYNTRWELLDKIDSNPDRYTTNHDYVKIVLANATSYGYSGALGA